MSKFVVCVVPIVPDQSGLVRPWFQNDTMTSQVPGNWIPRFFQFGSHFPTTILRENAESSPFYRQGNRDVRCERKCVRPHLQVSLGVRRAAPNKS